MSNRALLIAAFVVYGLLVFFSLPNDHVSHQDENYYFATTRTMQQTGEYLVPVYDGQERIKKPIVFYWLMLPAQVLFGHGFASTRLVSLISSLLLLAVTWRISAYCFAEQGRRVAAVWMLASADIVFRYAHYAVPEMTLTLMMTTAHWAFLAYDRARSRHEPARRFLLAFYAMMGLAFMVKGPVGVILPLATGLIAYLTQGRARDALRLLSPGGLLLLAAVVGPWYLMLLRRFGWEQMRAMIAHETLGRAGFHFSSLFYYVTFLLAYYLPWTLFLLDRRPHWFDWLRTRPRRAGMVRNYPLVWFATYFVFYSVFVAEKHSWYALQWAAPWVLLLSQAINLREVTLRRESIFRWFPAIAFGFAVASAVVFWLFGRTAASPAAGVTFAVLSVIFGIVLARLVRKRVAPLNRIAALAIIAMVLHLAVFQLLYTTTRVRPAMEFAHRLERAPGPYQLLIGDRYFNKKLARYHFPGMDESRYESDRSAFLEAWRRDAPEYVVCRERRLVAAPAAMRESYTVVADGYARKTSEYDNGVDDWWAFLKSRDTAHLFDRAVLLQRNPDVGQ